VIGYARARVSFPVMISRRRVDPEASISNRVCEITARGGTGANSASGDLPCSSFSTFGSLATCDDGTPKDDLRGRLSHAAPRSRTDSAWRTRLLVRYRGFELTEKAATRE
jgi:hypothetical protein